MKKQQRTMITNETDNDISDNGNSIFISSQKKNMFSYYVRISKRASPIEAQVLYNDITRYRNRRFRTGPESLKLEAGDMPPPEIIISTRYL